LAELLIKLSILIVHGRKWQDQIGGIVGETKIIFTEPGLIPDAKIHYLPTDLLDPKRNAGKTLLYYTGITRLAKNILQQVVSGYLNRDRGTMTTLKQIHDLPKAAANAISRKYLSTFGHVVSTAWQLNKQLDPNSTNNDVDSLLSKIQPYVFGSKLLGAGGGGFLLMVCKSLKDAERLRTMLESEPPNDRARFFDYDVNPAGLVVTVC